jgi:hypothetical protein
MGNIQYNDANFRALFPAFASTIEYPSTTLQLCWTTATAYISSCSQGGYGLKLQQQALALNQMTAHITQLMYSAASDQASGVVVGATVDKVTVTIMPPPATNEWRYWLNETPYGQMLLSLLEARAVGGFLAVGAVPFRL